jgi:7-cyano-7-deazaguanine synthase
MSASPDKAAAGDPLAVLVSGGLDSSILLAEACRRHPAVHPLYVRFGLHWEETELLYLRRFLEALPCSAQAALKPLVVLESPVADLYGNHWSITGQGVPGAETPDDAVFLPGRNVLLLAKPLLWCHLHRVPGLALAPLESNPFPDATVAFFRAYQNVVNQAVGGAVSIHLPYRGLHKVDVLKRGRDLPLEWTFSCIRPIGERHCGECNKCRERQKGFVEAGLTDPLAVGSR